MREPWGQGAVEEPISFTSLRHPGQKFYSNLLKDDSRVHPRWGVQLEGSAAYIPHELLPSPRRLLKLGLRFL